MRRVQASTALALSLSAPSLSLASVLCLALAACAGAPKKQAAPTVASPAPARATAATVDSTTAQPRRSPYAPAREDLSKRGDYTRGGLYAPHIRDSAPDDPLHDVDLIPEPEITPEPRSRYGNRSPYTVLGQSYQVRDSAEGYVEQGQASYYGNKFHGRRTSNLEVYDMYAFTAAHKTLPLPSFARVTNLDNGKSVVVRVNDRGPFHAGRVIDLSYAAAVKLGYRDRGTARVEVRGLGPGENAREPHDAIAARATGRPAPATGLDKLVGALPDVGAIASASAAARAAQGSPPATAPSPAMPAPSTASSAAGPSPNSDWRFDMRQDGKAMTADEFDAWMQSRRARVATGRPGRPDPAPASPVANPGRAIVPVAPPPPSPVTAAAVVAATSPERGRVTLQVASFANQQNASHALALLRDADIASARLLDASVNGQKVWRLRIGPVDAATAPELAARVVGLGFGQPQRVRD